VVVPSTAADAKGLMATAIRDDNPVVYLHHYMLSWSRVKYRMMRPRAVRQGRDSVARVRCDHCGNRLDGAPRVDGRGAARKRRDQCGSDRSPKVVPLDLETILRSVDKTGRVVLVDQAPRHASVSAMIAADIASTALEY